MHWKVTATECVDGMTRLTVELRSLSTDEKPKYTIWVHCPCTAAPAEVFAACAAAAKDHAAGDAIRSAQADADMMAEALGAKCAKFAGSV